MTGRLWRRSGSAAAVVLAVLTLSPAPSAWADAVITIDQPRADPALDSSSVTISGSVVSDSPLLSAPKKVTLTMKDQQAPDVTCADSPCKFSWPLTLTRNGPYDLTVSATDATRLLSIESQPKTQARHFAVAAPPKKPVLDPPRVPNRPTPASRTPCPSAPARRATTSRRAAPNPSRPPSTGRRPRSSPGGPGDR